jgi:multicomponent Na+:H+ antiporter subunit G
MADWVLYTAGTLSMVGSLFALVAAIGVVRLGDLYTRMHAATKAGTLGSGLLLAAVAVHSQDGGIVVRALAAVAFFLLTAPVSAHLLARAAYAAGHAARAPCTTRSRPVARPGTPGPRPPSRGRGGRGRPHEGLGHRAARCHRKAPAGGPKGR